MRLFAALPLPDSAIAHLFSLRLRLSEARDGLRWSTPEQWHITLQFYGEVTEEQFSALRQALAQSALPAVEVVLNELGLFERKGIFSVAADASEGLLALQKQVADIGAGCGVLGDSKAYRPHITLARSKGKTGDRSLQRLAKPQLPPFGAPVRWVSTECLLLESTLRPHGAVYEIRSHIPFRD